MIETRLLHYFLTIAKEQSITKAAEALHLTQPTLSKQMKELEEQLGKQLLIRGKRKTTLTIEGEYLRARAQEMMELLEKTESAFYTESKPIGGDIYLGCGETHAMQFLSQVYGKLHSRYPEVNFHIFSGDADAVLDRLDKGLIDMGLLPEPLRQEKYEYLRIGRQDSYGVLMRRDHPLAEKDVLVLEDLKDVSLFVPDQVLSGKLRYKNLTMDPSSFHIVATYNFIHSMTYLVEEGMGCALTPSNLVETGGSRGLVFRPIVPEVSAELSIVTKKYQTFSPAAEKYLDILREEVSLAG